MNSVSNSHILHSCIVQDKFPLEGTAWNPVGEPNYKGHEEPAIDTLEKQSVTVVGTVKNERIPFRRSFEIWKQQTIEPDMEVEYLVLDDGSTDGVEEEIKALKDEGHPIRYARYREPGEEGERSCTLLFNSALKHLVKTPLVMIQWWDRIPGSFTHLASLLKPHEHFVGVATSAVSRHIGGSSSMGSMTPAQLQRTLNLAGNWQEDPSKLAKVAGQIGGHCVPGQASESSGFVVRVEHLLALGGYDEAYQTRASYANVELWRRMLQVGLVGMFVPEPTGANYHQSHSCPTNRQKDYGRLSDMRVKRNQDIEWGALEPLEVW